MEDCVLITGGAGFVGSNLADRLLALGERVIVYDNFSRPGVQANARWLVSRHGDRVEVVSGDVRHADAVRIQVERARAVFHLAAQVAVTTSLIEPRHDFEVNAGGTLNVIDAARRRRTPPPLVFTSTNKVYGALGDLDVRENGARYEPEDERARARGIGESRALDFHSPYGCSKGCADQYVLDAARSFGIPSVVFRMSCIYGPRQFGTEDQGWVAHLLREAMEGRPLTFYGDGKQVRDLLYVGDLVEAFVRVLERAEALGGRAFNVGGGPERTLSLLELLDRLEGLLGESPAVTFAPWRLGDQRWYVSDPTALGQATGWRPTITVENGIASLHHWLLESRLPAVATAEAS